jgi:hypothetical protein
LPISPIEAARAGRFANFLARHYYRDRLARSFQYSYLFREATRRNAEQVADSRQFDSFLTRCVLGSLESAQRVGNIARDYLLAVESPAAWWPSLVEYEYAYFLQAATSEPAPDSSLPHQGRSALLKQFDWVMPELLSRIREFPLVATAATTSSTSEIYSDDFERPVTLLFSRHAEGKLFVVEVEASAAAVFTATDGSRRIEDIASVAGVSVQEVERIFSALTNIGAVALDVR